MSVSRINVGRRSNDETTIQEETFPAAEKILSDIENVMKKDPALRSFEIIPITDNSNKSPVYHEEHSLGLASWCVEPLYCYAHGRLTDSRRSEHRREESSTISRWLIGALLLNPDVATFWNMKRELVRAGRADCLAELRFAALVLHRKAKCYEAFAYRRWLLRHLLCGGDTTGAEKADLIRDEIRVAGVSADRYANNYHAWSHRQHVILKCRESLSDDYYESLLKSEWRDSAGWCDRHVSDHSGLAYRQFLLNHLLYEESNEVGGVAPNVLAERRFHVETLFARDEELRLKDDTRESWQLLNALHNRNIDKQPEIDYDRVLVALSYWAEDCGNNVEKILSFPGHEALWYHRRYLGHALASLENSYRKFCRYERESRCMEAREAAPQSLLSLVFRSDNERILAVSRNLKQQAQTILGEKFVKYLDEFYPRGEINIDEKR